MDSTHASDPLAARPDLNATPNVATPTARVSFVPKWLRIPERGSWRAVVVFTWALSIGGRRFARMVLWPTTLYFYLTSPRARAASRAFMRRIGREGTRWETFLHFLRFAQCTADRVLLARGDLKQLEVIHGPHEVMMALQSARRGAILLGAHMGSFEAMATMAESDAITVTAVVNNANARGLYRVLAQLNPRLADRVLDMKDGGLDLVFALRERLEKGEHIAILADRNVPGGRSVVVPFMGQPARFPAGPFILAATLGCPIYFVAGLYEGGRRYRVHAEQLASRIELPRRDRDAALVHWVGLYAERLGVLAQKAPENWFNFYDFWDLHE